MTGHRAVEFYCWKWSFHESVAFLGRYSKFERIQLWNEIIPSTLSVLQRAWAMVIQPWACQEGNPYWNIHTWWSSQSERNVVCFFLFQWWWSFLRVVLFSIHSCQEGPDVISFRWSPEVWCNEVWQYHTATKSEWPINEMKKNYLPNHAVLRWSHYDVSIENAPNSNWAFYFASWTSDRHWFCNHYNYYYNDNTTIIIKTIITCLGFLGRFLLNEIRQLTHPKHH